MNAQAIGTKNHRVTSHNRVSVTWRGDQKTNGLDTCEVGTGGVGHLWLAHMDTYSMDTYEIGTAGVGHLWLGHLDTCDMDTYEVDTDGLRHLWLEHLGEDSYGLESMAWTP